MEQAVRGIYNYISAHPYDPEPYKAMLDILYEHIQTGEMEYVWENRKWRQEIEKAMVRITGASDVVRLGEQYRRSLLMGARYCFDDFLQYVELDRDPGRRFYAPRRSALYPVAEALQELEDDKLDLLAISMPPGVGKSTMAIFYLTWIAGRHPSEPSLGGSHSNSFLRGVYDECLRIIQGNGEYLWADVFPNVGVVTTNAKDLRLDLGHGKRFETLEFSSIGSGNAGKVRAGRLLYCDDLVSGIEEALSKERLDKLWQQYTTDFRQRKIGNCKELHIATRWSVHDVIGRLESQYGEDPRAKFIVMPALNAEDKSNFDYGYNIGFTTEFYHQQREVMDDASWRALYMNEPIEREGLLYNDEELRRFFDLPDQDPDAIIAVCDTKDKGKDYCVLPVAYVYGSDYYIADCVCDNGLPDVVDLRLIDTLCRDKVQMARFESNSAGGRVAKTVQDGVHAKGGITHITTKYTTANKETKIIVNSSWIKQHCLFLDKSKYRRQSDYGNLMNMLCTYTVAGKNTHDDVPDAMAQLAEFAQSMTRNTVEVFKSPFVGQ